MSWIYGITVLTAYQKDVLGFVITVMASYSLWQQRRDFYRMIGIGDEHRIGGTV